MSTRMTRSSQSKLSAAAVVWVEGLESRQLMSVGPVQTAVRLETNLGRITAQLFDN